MAHVLKGSHSFTCTSCVHPPTEWTISAFAFPAKWFLTIFGLTVTFTLDLNIYWVPICPELHLSRKFDESSTHSLYGMPPKVVIWPHLVLLWRQPWNFWPKSNRFMFVPTCTEAVNLVKFPQVICKLFTNC